MVAKVERREAALLTRLRMLTPEKLTEVEDFVAFLTEKRVDRGLVAAAAAASTPALLSVWDNDEDAVYDAP